VSDDRLIRISNLRRVCAERRLKTADLHRLLPYARYTYWRDVLEGDKPFGEKAARKVEAKLGLPDRWLDTPRDPVEFREVLPSVPDDDEDEHPDEGGHESHWRHIAELFADICTEQDIKMLPSTFLLIVDAGVQRVNEAADKRKASEVFSKLLRVLQHGKDQNRG
jgi:hypothetical protein